MEFNEIKICKPKKIRIVDITDKDYFSKSYSEYISNSKLSLLNPAEGGSPEKFKMGLGDNKIYSNALEFGSAVHQLVLQPGEFYLSDEIDRPTGKIAFMADFLLERGYDIDQDVCIIDAAKEVDYFHGILTRDKIQEVRNKMQPYFDYFDNARTDTESPQEAIYLSSYDRYRCQMCLDSVKKHPQMQKLLYPKDAATYNEATLLAEIDIEIPKEKLVTLKFKGKLDNYTVNDTKVILNDLKTTGKQIPEFTKSFAKYHYARQLGLYIYFLKWMYPKVDIFEANILAVQTAKPFTAHVFPVSLESINNGLKEAANLLRSIAFYEVYGYDKNISDYYGGYAV
jgi:hypothetical protein